MGLCGGLPISEDYAEWVNKLALQWSASNQHTTVLHCTEVLSCEIGVVTARRVSHPSLGESLLSAISLRKSVHYAAVVKGYKLNCPDGD